MKWGVRRFQKKKGGLTSAGKKRYSASKDKKRYPEDKGEKVFNTLKKGANRALDKADSDNFFKSKSIFSEESMKRQARIDAARNAINGLDYKTLKSPNGRKHLVDTGKKVLNEYLDDADDRSFFNDDRETRNKKRERNDFIRDIVNN